jgi:DNA processing protein
MTATANTLAILRLLAVRGVGAARARKVIERARHASISLADLMDSPAALAPLLSPAQIAALSDTREAIARMVAELYPVGAEIVGICDEDYPEKLRQQLGEAAPLFLIYRGKREILDQIAVGFCGSRKASEKGLGVARDCAEQCVRSGLAIVSGYAAGVDLCTHRTALEQGGTTIIVLPEGIAHLRIKRELKDVWDWSRVCVVSEFGPRTKWSAGNAMQRNHTICGLSDAMLLIEARSTGGSIAAGKVCLRHDIPLFAPEYEGMPEWAVGNRQLLAQGARPLRKARESNRAALHAVFAAIHAAKRQRSGRENEAPQGSQLGMFS